MCPLAALPSNGKAAVTAEPTCFSSAYVLPDNETLEYSMRERAADPL